jgi:hypothetical protein
MAERGGFEPDNAVITGYQQASAVTLYALEFQALRLVCLDFADICKG